MWEPLGEGAWSVCFKPQTFVVLLCHLGKRVRLKHWLNSFKETDDDFNQHAPINRNRQSCRFVSPDSITDSQLDFNQHTPINRNWQNCCFVSPDSTSLNSTNHRYVTALSGDSDVLCRVAGPVSSLTRMFELQLMSALVLAFQQTW